MPFCCFSFFFYCYCHPRDLHSFPTRRSSDLLRGSDRVPTREVGRAFVGRAAHERPQPGPCPEDVGLSDRDRKSTRLNSSHRCISYAVFCLKKKKKKQHIDDTT